MSRLYCPLSLTTGQTFDLPPTAARHAQVLRLQPGASLSLFDGLGGAWQAEITGMGRQSVQALVLSERELSAPPTRCVTLAVGMPANERMDWLVEKATELGVSRLVPLMTERTVVRLSGERAEKRLAHWRAIAAGACEQSGRDWLPTIDPICGLSEWLRTGADSDASACRIRLSLAGHATPWTALGLGARQTLIATLGPEGGFSEAEEQTLNQAGWQGVSLGQTVLRTETAALTVLARWADAMPSTSVPGQ
jgi:16S rRNA (uracil1498-N3)-methyltransferase